jgi:hypothetical protein
LQKQIQHPPTAREGVKMMIEQIVDDSEKLRQLYEKVVEQPNKDNVKKGLICCPECSEEILLIPTLKLMSTAIENHIHTHREQLKTQPIKEYQTAIRIRLSMVEQVMQQACRMQVS